jgi:hypothetical protein
MRPRSSCSTGIVAITLAVAAYLSLSETAAAVPGCLTAGIGTLPSGDTFFGKVVGPNDGRPSGAWTHITSRGDRLVVRASGLNNLICRINGAIAADIGGTGAWNGADGYRFLVHIQDLGPPERGPGSPLGNPEERMISATRYYSPTRWDDGHALFPHIAQVTIPQTLPVTIGNAGNHEARLTLVRYPDLETIRCDYRGGASTSNPTRPDDVARGLEYRFERCHSIEGSSGSGHGDRLAPGDIVDASLVHLRVQEGSSRYPSRTTAQTTVSVELNIRPYIGRTDFYRILVFDPTGALVYDQGGDLILGDTTVDHRFDVP